MTRRTRPVWLMLIIAALALLAAAVFRVEAQGAPPGHCLWPTATTAEVWRHGETTRAIGADVYMPDGAVWWFTGNDADYKSGIYFMQLADYALIYLRDAGDNAVGMAWVNQEASGDLIAMVFELDENNPRRWNNHPCAVPRWTLTTFEDWAATMELEYRK